MSTAVLAPTTRTRSQRPPTGRWVIDPHGTVVQTTVRALGIPVHGRFGGATGVIDVPRDITRSQVTVSMRADSFATGRATRDRRARGRGFLDADAHPTMSFSAEGLLPIMEQLVTADGDRPLWWLDGAVTARGVTHPVRLAVGAVRQHDDGETLEFNATARVRRSVFGVAAQRRLLGDMISVTVRGRARREQPDVS